MKIKHFRCELGVNWLVSYDFMIFADVCSKQTRVCSKQTRVCSKQTRVYTCLF